MVFLILESLGSTELVFILVMALVFFGPRKLPQMSRSMGKHLAEFRKASEDFKRTWDREVSLEEITSTPTPNAESAMWDENANSQTFQPPTIEAIAPDRVIPREAGGSTQTPPADAADLSSVTDNNTPIDSPEPSRKRDWL